MTNGFKELAFILRKICSDFPYLVQRGPTDYHVSIMPPSTYVAVYVWPLSAY